MFFAFDSTASCERAGRARVLPRGQTARRQLMVRGRHVAGATATGTVAPGPTSPRRRSAPMAASRPRPGATKWGVKGLGLLCFDRSHVEQPLDHFRLLRPGDRMAPGNDEAGHAVDAQPVRPQAVGMNRIEFVVTY
jgi:hypothetical protein